MIRSLYFLSAVAGLALCASAPSANCQTPSVETQLPRKMHARMTEPVRISVGLREADVVGSDHRALQAAVDYVGALGGGVVEIGPGEYRMRDSLHLRSNVTVRGTPGKTVLRKEAAAVSPLAIDGDFGEEQITLRNPAGFQVGDGVAIWDQRANGFHVTVARITGRREDTFALSLPLNADCMADNGGTAATVFPVISGYHLEGVVVSDLIIHGNKAHNVGLNGCRGGGIFLYRCPGALIERCVVRDYHGDGISFQQSNDVTVRDCVAENNAGLGLHPGSGSQRPVVRSCTARSNGEDGLFLCWRVKDGLFENNLLENNRRFGISIGHKDTDNLLRANRVVGNTEAGIFFRNETSGMAGHRNRLEDNLIENNGQGKTAAGIRVRGETTGLIFRNNIIRDTRPEAERRQTIGIHLESQVGSVALEGNQIEAVQPVLDERATR